MIEITDRAAGVLFDMLEDTIADLEYSRENDSDMWTQLDEEKFHNLCNIRKQMIEAGCY